MQQWEAVADGVAEAAVLMRSETLRPEGDRSRAWAQRQQTKVERGLRWMNERLGAKYCAGERLSLADIALGLLRVISGISLPGRSLAGPLRGGRPQFACNGRAPVAPGHPDTGLKREIPPPMPSR